MIIDYSDFYYDDFASRESFDVSYLLSGDPFNKSFVYIDDIVVGFISFSVIYDRIELNYIWVDEGYRKRGIASLLMDFMISYCDFLNITLEVSVDNVCAFNLYKKFGFEIVCIRKNYYGKCDAYLMMKEVV